MKHLLNWVEIPALDIERAKKFYGTILDVSFIDYPTQDENIKYVLFPSEDKYNAGALVQSPNHKPSGQGVVIYLDGGEDMNSILNQVEGAGGRIVMPKTYAGSDAGYIGLFTDTEGNMLGLQHS